MRLHGDYCQGWTDSFCSRAEEKMPPVFFSFLFDAAHISRHLLAALTRINATVSQTQTQSVQLIKLTTFLFFFLSPWTRRFISVRTRGGGNFQNCGTSFLQKRLWVRTVCPTGRRMCWARSRKWPYSAGQSWAKTPGCRSASRRAKNSR